MVRVKHQAAVWAKFLIFRRRHVLLFWKRHLGHTLANIFPDDEFSSYLRCLVYRIDGAKFAPGVWLCGGVTIWCVDHRTIPLTIGRDTFINRNAYIDASAPVTIGANVAFGQSVSLVTGSHRIGPAWRRTGPSMPQPITIGDGAWIGANAVILPGVTVGQGSIVGAGSVVTKDVPPNTLVAGNPAHVIKELDGTEEHP